MALPYTKPGLSIPASVSRFMIFLVITVNSELLEPAAMTTWRSEWLQSGKILNWLSSLLRA